MAHLSSCYFCGTALDEPLGTYGVGEGRTVTLCPTCRRKLETVLGTAGGSLADVDEPEPAAVTAPEDDDPDADRHPEDDDPDAGDELAEETGADPLVGDGSDDVSEGDGAAVDADAGDGDPFETGVELFDVDADDDPEQPDEGTVPDAAGGSGGIEDADDAAGGDPEASGSSGTGTDGQADGSGEVPPSDDPSGGTSQPSLSALEYNKVMRLLQNREFPLDRAEIEAVATNAYDLSQSDCAAVIDLAIDRGLLEETDGQLRRSE